jgi:predicted nucleotidyltransferase|tara:strand:- start:279 stop:446 length:168 start_codon:yes stop_codon:yes gene_type:complete
MEEELQSSFVPLAKSLEEYLHHQIDVITEGDWFDELIDKKVTEIINRKLTNLGKD